MPWASNANLPEKAAKASALICTQSRLKLTISWPVFGQVKLYSQSYNKLEIVTALSALPKTRCIWQSTVDLVLPRIPF